MALSLPMSVSFPLLSYGGYLSLDLGPTHKIQDGLILGYLIISINSHFPNKVTFTCSGVQNLDVSIEGPLVTPLIWGKAHNYLCHTATYFVSPKPSCVRSPAELFLLGYRQETSLTPFSNPHKFYERPSCVFFPCFLLHSAPLEF